MNRITAMLVACLVGCSSPQEKDQPAAEAVVEAIPAADLSKMKAQVTAAEARAAKAEAKDKALKAALSEPDPEGIADEAPADMCWADYCPCDTSDPDYGFADIPICRNLKMGVHVDDQMFSVGAASRDARKAIREHKEQYGGDF